MAIDGPAGAGKSSVALALAKRLGVPMLDTGAIYRSLAWWSSEKGLAWESEDELFELLSDFPLRFVPDAEHPRGCRVWMRDIDITDAIRSQAIGLGASIVSAHPKVRASLLGLQRKLAQGGCVAEGRDMGSVVLPDADFKFFLTASPRARALRRYAELEQKGGDLPTLEEVEAEIVLRDERDLTRSAAPLRQAPGAIRVDSSDLSAQEVVEQLWELMHGAKCP